VGRLDAGQSMPGVFAVPSRAALGAVIEDLALVIECSFSTEWEGQVIFLPL
jgi:hypothetical protein